MADVRFLIDALTQDILRSVVKAAGEAIPEIERNVRTAFEKELGAEARLRINTRAAQVGQEATLLAYAETVESNGHFSYTRRTRFGGGALRRALESDRFIAADADHIAFGNVTLLNRKAKQWARLNFGAGQHGAENQRKSALGTVRPAFMIPEGAFWYGKYGKRVGKAGNRKLRVGGGVRSRSFYESVYEPNFQSSRRGKDVFYPGRTPLRMFLTRGIAGRYFLDAGAGAMAAELQRGYKEAREDFNRTVSEGIERAAKDASG